MPPDDATDAMATLNRWLDGNGAERLQIPIITRTVFDLTSGIQGYTFASSNTSTETTEDGFEGVWVDSLPPDWNISGTRSDVSESSTAATVQSGSKAVGILSSVAGATVLSRDFPARPNQRGFLSFYLRSNAGGAAVVRLRNLATGNYLNSSGAWVGSATAALTDIGVPYTLISVSFTVESTADPRLRVEMTTGVNSALGLFDEMTFTLFGGGAILIPRPIFVNGVSYVDTTLTTLTEVPLIELTDQAWQSLSMKAMTSTVPTHYYYNPTYPEGTLQFWPIPTSSTLRGVIYVPTPTSQFSTLDDVVTLPPGYEQMIVKNLALQLCPSYKVNPSPLLVKQAADTLAIVKRANYRPTDMSFSASALVGNRGAYWYDIRTGQ